jgi:apolipoprotein N-acyltransferase
LAGLMAALSTSGLLWLSYFPAAWGWLVWFALVPWLMLVRAELPRGTRYPIAWLAGLAFFVPALSWMRVAHAAQFYSWLALSVYCSWYFPLALWLLRRLDRRTALPLTVTVPVVWTALEYVRSNFAGGFAWYLLGQSQHNVLPLIQVADLAGVGAVTFLVAAVNGLLAEAISGLRITGFFQSAIRNPQSAIRLRPQAVVVAAALAVVLAYGGWRLGQAEFADGPRVALLQTCIPQGDRNAADMALPDRDWATESIAVQTHRLTRQAVQASPKPDLVIWPETTFPWDWLEVGPGAPPGKELEQFNVLLHDHQRRARDLAAFTGTNILLGLNAQVFGADGKPRRYNSAMLMAPEGGAVTRYDKMHLVPFGEYVPFRDSIPALKKLAPYDFDYSLAAGEVPTRLTLSAGGNDYRFGVLICYEDSDAPLAREYVRPGTGPLVDFLVNISNDGWFMNTAEHAEHLAVSRFRAVECRRALVRAVNGGISAVIDGNGRVVAKPADTWEASHSIAAVVSAAVPIDTRASLYARLGDWLPVGCWVVLAVGCFWRRPKAGSAHGH